VNARLNAIFARNGQPVPTNLKKHLTAAEDRAARADFAAKSAAAPAFAARPTQDLYRPGLDPEVFQPLTGAELDEMLRAEAERFGTPAVCSRTFQAHDAMPFDPEPLTRNELAAELERLAAKVRAGDVYILTVGAVGRFSLPDFGPDEVAFCRMELNKRDW
jgi:hypothetical protein